MPRRQRVGETAGMTSPPPLYGSEQSRFARYLERRETRNPDPVARELRRQLIAGLRGRVIEVGCGDGRNFEHYLPQVTQVVGVEPDPNARAAAAERAAEAQVPIEIVEGVASPLPAEDASFDAALIVWVLCSVPDPAAALQELRRVLVPGGELWFYEHVRSENTAFRALQRAGDALFWTRALGGCETTRDSVRAIEDAGFEIASLDRGFQASTVLTITAAPYVLGVARNPGGRVIEGDGS
jgi:ubiquinone/menaquinone biosynthesis C-methylase UbiE